MLAMLQEIEAASWWWTTQMQPARLSAFQISTFQQTLAKYLRDKYTNHWHEDQPLKGSAYRSVCHDMYGLDPALEAAASAANIVDIKARIPQDVTMWVDPTDVSVKYDSTNIMYSVYKRKPSSKPHVANCVAS